MNIKGKLYVEVNVERYRVPDFEQQLRVENNNVQVLAVEKNSGKKYWINLSSLKNNRDAEERVLQDLIWELSDIQSRLEYSKAEMKRKLVEYGIVNK